MSKSNTKISTKQVIIDQAIKVFNERGYDAVSLQELAGEIGISRGNLTYHFKEKDTLLEAIADQMWERLEQERSITRKIPSFKNIHHEVQIYYKIQKMYGFIFLDTKLLAHDVVKERFQTMTEQSIEDNVAAIAFSISAGSMKPESIKGTYHHLAFLTWMIPFFWYAQQVIKGVKSEQDIERVLWSIIIPHFTEKGLANFRSFYGAEYLDQLGVPFELSAESFISF